MNENIILTIAQAILANSQVLQTLVNALPQQTKVEIEKVVAAAAPKPAPKAEPFHTSPTPAPAAAMPGNPAYAPSNPQLVPVPVQGQPVMPPPPVFTAPAPAAPVTLGSAPFTDSKGLIGYVMGVYKTLGQEKGAGIQTVLNSLGAPNINDVSVAQYDALYHGVEALKASV